MVERPTREVNRWITCAWCCLTLLILGGMVLIVYHFRANAYYREHATRDVRTWEIPVLVQFGPVLVLEEDGTVQEHTMGGGVRQVAGSLKWRLFQWGLRHGGTTAEGPIPPGEFRVGGRRGHSDWSIADPTPFMASLLLLTLSAVFFIVGRVSRARTSK